MDDAEVQEERHGMDCASVERGIVHEVGLRFRVACGSLRYDMLIARFETRLRHAAREGNLSR